MKIYEKFNELVKSKKDRTLILQAAVSIYWLKELIFLGAMFVRLAMLQGYDSLFEAVSFLSGSSQSFIVRMAFAFLESGRVSVNSFVNAFGVFTGMDLLMIGATVLALSALGFRKCRLYLADGIAMLAFLFAAIAFGLGSSSLLQAIAILRALSYTELFLGGILTIAFVLCLYHSLYTLIASRLENRSAADRKEFI